MKKGAILSVILFAVTFIISLPSCTKPGASSKKAKVLFVNAAPNAPALDFYMDATKENSTPVAYQSISAYSAIASGAYTFKATVDSNGSTVIDTTINLASGTPYSAFVVGTSPNISALVLNDSLATPPSGMATIRIVDAVSNSPAFSIGVPGTSALATNLNFENNTGFIAVSPGSLTLQLTLTTGGAIVTTFQSITLTSGKGYTVCLTGVYGSGIAPVLIENL